jgi:hypothetical protein
MNIDVVRACLLLLSILSSLSSLSVDVKKGVYWFKKVDKRYFTVNDASPCQWKKEGQERGTFY